MKYYLMFPDVAKNKILVRGKLSNPTSYQKYNHSTKQWDSDMDLLYDIEIDTATPRREISEQEAQRMMQAA